MTRKFAVRKSPCLTNNFATDANGVKTIKKVRVDNLSQSVYDRAECPGQKDVSQGPEQGAELLRSADHSPGGQSGKHGRQVSAQ